MLRLHTPTGSIEALPQEEARVRALTNEALRRELASPDPDLFAVAEAISRQVVVFTTDRGWHVADRFLSH